MTLSAVVPVFDDEAHLADALARLTGQRGVDLEVVVVDDGSRDGSLAIARAAAELDDRVVVVALSPNAGPAPARQAGVARATGEYVWFVDSDDAWEPDAGRLLVAAARAAEADVVVAAATMVTAGGAVRTIAPPEGLGVVGGERALELALTGEITGHLWNKLFRRSLFDGVAFVPARTQSDLPVVLGGLARADRVVLVQDRVYEYRVRRGSVITTRTSRAASLALIDADVRRLLAAEAPRLLDGPAHRYFTTRYVVLSGLKDLRLGAAGGAEHAAATRALRRRLGPKELWALASRRDVQRLAMAVAARTSARLHLLLLRVADR